MRDRTTLEAGPLGAAPDLLGGTREEIADKYSSIDRQLLRCGLTHHIAELVERLSGFHYRRMTGLVGLNAIVLPIF
jgi:hypothetical protein